MEKEKNKKMKVNINWIITEVTKEELDKYKYKYPNINYYIIDNKL